MDIQPADGSAVTMSYENGAERDETSDEKMENTSEMKTGYTDTNEVMVDEAVKHLVAKDKQSDEEHEGALDEDIKSTDLDEVLLPLAEVDEYSETDEKSDEKLEDTSEMETECMNTKGTEMDEAKDEKSVEEHEDTSDKNTKSIDVDEVLLPLTEAKEYSGTGDIEYNQISTATWERTEQATGGSTGSMDSEIMTGTDEKSDQKLENTSEMEIECTNTKGTVMGDAKYEEHEDTLDKDTKSTDRTDRDETSDQKLENTSEVEIGCTDTNEVMIDEAVKHLMSKDKQSDEEHEGALDEDVKSTDVDEVLLPLAEVKEYSETGGMEYNQESVETWDREIEATDSSGVTMNFENMTDIDEKSDGKLGNTLETEIECADTTGTMVDEAKDEKSGEEHEDSLDKDTKSTDLDELLLPLAEAEEYSGTGDVECNEESAETWDREIQPADSSGVTMNRENMTDTDEKLANTSEMEIERMNTDGTMVDETQDEEYDEECEGSFATDMKFADSEEMLLPSAEAKEYSETGDEESAETFEMEMKCPESKAVQLSEVEKWQELLDTDVKETSKPNGRWSATDAVMMEDANDASVAVTADDSSRDSCDRDDVDDAGGSCDGAEHDNSSLSKICADYEDDRQVR